MSMGSIQLTQPCSDRPITRHKPEIDHYWTVYGPSVECRDFESPDQAQLETLSLSRLLEILKYGSIQESTILLFPQSGDTFFYPDSRALEIRTEYDRVVYMLENFPERGIPVLFADRVRDVLKSDSILDAWIQQQEEFKRISRNVLSAARDQMSLARKGVEKEILGKEDIWADPVLYKSDANLSISFWQRASREAARQISDEDNPQALEAYLGIHAFIRDPIGCLHLSNQSRLGRSLEMASLLIQEVETFFIINGLKPPRYSACFVAQLALEAKVLAEMQDHQLAHLRVDYQRQLMYAYVEIDCLQRSEFSKPVRLRDLLAGIVEGASIAGECLLAPITVARVAPYNPEDPLMSVIIDGNNRTTALMLLRFLANHLSDDDIPCSLKTYCAQHRLGTKWYVDLLDAYSYVASHASFSKLDQGTIARFANISKVPALIVEESDFLTLCMRTGTRESPVLLQPMHQTIYNDERAGLSAFRAKAGQAHGKAKSWPLLPLKLTTQTIPDSLV